MKLLQTPVYVLSTIILCISTTGCFPTKGINNSSTPSSIQITRQESEPVAKKPKSDDKQVLSPRLPFEEEKEEVVPKSDSTFGSQAILNTCWTPTQLIGKSTEKKVRHPIKNPIRQPLLTSIPLYTNSPIAPKLHNSIRRVIPSKDKKIIALTFDLCERTNEKTGYDSDIVNYLRKYRVKATFYTSGKWMHSHPEKTMQLMADPLFEIGNHAWTHGNLHMLTKRKIENQILWTQAQYEILGMVTK